jgi:hypothetical protein
MAPNFPLCTKNTQEHDNIRVKRKKESKQTKIPKTIPKTNKQTIIPKTIPKTNKQTTIPKTIPQQMSTT